MYFHMIHAAILLRTLFFFLFKVNCFHMCLSKIYKTFSCKPYLCIHHSYLTVCSYHVTYAFQSEPTLYSCLNVKELLAQSRREILGSVWLVWLVQARLTK